MKMIASLIVFSSLFANLVSAQNLPFNPIHLPDYTAAKRAEGNSRLKISVASEDSSQLPVMKFGGVVLCSKTTCYRPRLIEKMEISRGGNGYANLIVDSLIPSTQIETIYFEDSRDSSVSGSATLSRPLDIKKGYYGGEIFVALKSDAEKRLLKYHPSFATSNLISEGGQSVYYIPKRPLNVPLSRSNF